MADVPAVLLYWFYFITVPSALPVQSLPFSNLYGIFVFSEDAPENIRV